MTDEHPGERPDFAPPEGADPLPGGTYPPPPPPPGPSSTPQDPSFVPPEGPPFPPPEGPSFPPPQGPPAGYPPPPGPVQHQEVLPPGPYRQPWPPPPRPPRERPKGKGSIWLGIGITLATLLLATWLNSATSYGSPLYDLASGALAIAPVLLIVVGIVLAVVPKTTRTGAGILLGLGAAVLIAGGICVALLVMFVNQ